MEVWNSIGRHKRSPERLAQLVQLFQNIWTDEGIFGTMDSGKPRWNIIPPSLYLPQTLASQIPDPFRQIPIRNRSPDRDSFLSRGSTEIETAIDALFEEVNQALEDLRTNSPTTSTQDPTKLSYSQERRQRASPTINAPHPDQAGPSNWLERQQRPQDWTSPTPTDGIANFDIQPQDSILPLDWPDEENNSRGEQGSPNSNDGPEPRSSPSTADTTLLNSPPSDWQPRPQRSKEYTNPIAKRNRLIELYNRTDLTKTIQQVRREVSPASTRLLDQHLQQEIDDMLRTVEEERYRTQVNPPLSPRSETLVRRTEDEMRAHMDDTPYTAADLPEVVRCARRNPHFQGLAALELYTDVAQHLEGDNYRQWMIDGKGYFNLGKRHPR